LDLNVVNFEALVNNNFIIFKRLEYDPVHIINNIRCESHRWAFIRAIKNETQMI